MGLDHEIRRMSKPNLNKDPSIVYERNELIDYLIFRGDEIEDPMYMELKPYAQKVMMRDVRTDYTKLRREFQMDESLFVSEIGSGMAVIRDLSGKQIKITVQELYDRFTARPVIEASVVCSTQVQYWRKRYDIQDWFHENIGRSIMNCGFYGVSEDLIEEFNEAFPDDKIYERDDLFYWEWY